MTGGKTSDRKIGSLIAILGSLASAGAFAVGLVPVRVGTGMAVVCIIIGAAVMRGRFSKTQDSTKRS